MFAVCMASYALNVPVQQDDRTRQSRQQKPNDNNKTKNDTAKAVVSDLSKLTIEDDSIPDSLLHSRWTVQRTVPLTDEDLDKRMADLSFPSNKNRRLCIMTR